MFYNPGDGGEALEDLTGAPSKNYKMSDLPVDELWEKVKSADALDYTMSLSCGKENAEATEKMGLQSSHQYGLLVAKEYVRFLYACKILPKKNTRNPCCYFSLYLHREIFALFPLETHG